MEENTTTPQTVNETNSKSTTALTDEQKHFYQLLRIRATSESLGQPYIAYAIFKLIPVNAPGLGTMGVDPHYRLYIDFDFMMEKGIEYASQVLNHEPWHLLRNHEERRITAGADGTQWNIVGDLEINDDLVGKVPDVSLFPHIFNLPENETAEYYYEELKKRADENKAKQQQSGQTQQGEQTEGQQEQPNGASINPNNIDDIFATPNEVCGNVPEEYRLSKEEAESIGEFEKEMIAREVAQQTKDYAQRNPGQVPQGAKLWADAKLKPTPTPWQKVLRGALRSALDTRGQTDYVRSRPNRKQPIKGILLPAMRSPRPRVVIGIDTSGSHVPMLPTVLDEIHSIIKKVGIRGNELRAFSIDTEMKDKPTYVNDPRKIDLTGGGGTDMMPAFEWVANNKKDVDVFVLMTDGEIPQYPANAPTNKIKFVICILNWETDPSGRENYNRAVKEAGNWAKIVHINVPET